MKFFMQALLVVFLITGLTNTTPLGLSFSNWDGMMVCRPSTYETPKDVREISELIKQTVLANETLKVIGAGLSFSGAQLSNGNMISLDKMTSILNILPLPRYEGEGALVKVEAGIRLRQLVIELAKFNLTMPNLGATATQSLAGAASTGTHGTGMKLGNIASQIEELEIVDGLGNIHRCSQKINKELFEASKVSIGALGIIYSITLRTVPLFKLRKRIIPYNLSDLLRDLPLLTKKYERLQWSFSPYNEASASLILREEVPYNSTILPRSQNKSQADDDGCWSETLDTNDCTDWSYKALTDSYSHYRKRSLYTEMEMFIPVESTIPAVLDYIDWMNSVKSQHDQSVTVSVMIRYIKGDNVFLSPMYGRNSAVISVIVLGNFNQTGCPREFELYSKGLETLTMNKYGGRPHWGKKNYFTRPDLEKVYAESLPLFDEIRMRMDPHGIFRNDYLEQRMGYEYVQRTQNEQSQVKQ